MKRKHMNHIQDIIRRLQLGESERSIAQDMQISRGTVHKYHEVAKQKGYLDKSETPPSDGALKEALGPGVQPPQQASTVEPYRETIQDWLKQEVEMTAIWLRLQENYGYKGGYSSVRRFVHRLEPTEPDAFVRVHSDPGECVIRSKATTDSGASRPLNPEDVVHRFRCMPSTFCG